MTFFSLFTSGWHGLAAIGALIIAVVASYVGGKKIGKVQQQARSEADSARQEANRMANVTHQQQRNSEEAKRVATDNLNLDDAAARDKLQQSKYHQP
ncbi:hypothetical protein OLZ33_12665 [Pantoea ananatis]|uniref:hypothetical protein n=1 Tax=Pantoea ananas TaxID=553 RepID=UPI000D5E295D|nr:hypothetical protein [Pantoea ananatis]MCW1832834.1 hypothetical protein [Pantoea ananatis]PVY87640.1 hypothetical protein C7427_10181 [Pantoea ananatis]HCP28009.1 hypothetical protein [Pantoea ananatis]